MSEIKRTEGSNQARVLYLRFLMPYAAIVSNLTPKKSQAGLRALLGEYEPTRHSMHEVPLYIGTYWGTSLIRNRHSPSTTTGA